jgi:nitrogen fixation-related uncharacterized protein
MNDFWADFLSVENILGHLAYVLAVISMIMRSMPWLRLFAILSGMAAMVYFGMIRSDYVSTVWEFGYTAVAAFQLFLLWWENREGQFNDEQRAFVHRALLDLKPVHAARLLKGSRVMTSEPGATLLRQGEMPSQLFFILSGEVAVSVDGEIVGHCGQGDFLGEMSFLSARPANATVTSLGECRMLVFERDRLVSVLQKLEPVRHAFNAGISRNILDKINRMNANTVLRGNAVVAS